MWLKCTCSSFSQCYNRLQNYFCGKTKCFREDDPCEGKNFSLFFVCNETTLNPFNEICMMLDEDGPFSVCTKLFDGNSVQPPKTLQAGPVFDIEHISHYRLLKQQLIDFSDIVVFLCSALGLGSGRIQCLQRAGGAPHRFKRLEVGQLEEPNRYILSGKGLTMH